MVKRVPKNDAFKNSGGQRGKVKKNDRNQEPNLWEEVRPLNDM